VPENPVPENPVPENHVGCVAEFRNAHIYIQRREITGYRAALALPRRFEFLTRSCEPGLPALLDERGRAGLATLADGELEVAPGVALWPAFGTHTAGSQLVSVTTERNGRWLLAGDNVYAYENLEGLGGASARASSPTACTAPKSANAQTSPRPRPARRPLTKGRVGRAEPVRPPGTGHPLPAPPRSRRFRALLQFWCVIAHFFLRDARILRNNPPGGG
jgi:hypothetical protein